MKTITITIKPDGSTTITTSGFTGGECKVATAPYERALGAVTADVPTAESRLTASATSVVQTQLGG